MTTDTTTTGKRHWVAGAIAALGLLAAVAWGAVAGAMDTIGDLPRTDVPGQLAVAVEEPGTQTVYYERRSWTVTTPLDRDIDLEVSGPEAEQVTIEPYDTPVTYRLLQRVGQAHATFVADPAGEYTITVGGDVPDDASIAVAADPPTRLMSGLIGPAVLLLAAFGAAAAIASSGRGRSRSAPPQQTADRAADVEAADTSSTGGRA